MVGEVVPGQKTTPNEKVEDKYFLYTHLKFIITANQDRIIEVNLTSENPVPIDR